jgi:hypothetical protein
MVEKGGLRRAKRDEINGDRRAKKKRVGVDRKGPVPEKISKKPPGRPNYCFSGRETIV